VIKISVFNIITKYSPIMGLCCSSVGFGYDQAYEYTASELGSSRLLVDRSENKWRQVLDKNQARDVYVKDGTLPVGAASGVVALRVFLEDPSSVCSLAEYAKTINMLELLLCWIEVLDYKLVSIGNGYKLSKANYIYHKYFKVDAVVSLPALSRRVSAEYRIEVQSAICDAEELHTYTLADNLFDLFGQLCLLQMHKDLFTPFKRSVKYLSSLRAFRSTFNRVLVDDFEYMEFLGEGSFGVVVHCKKKSTGKHYAMKIQTKAGLLNQFADAPHRVVFEKEALAKCHHPFIVNMDYSFQTPQFAIMVTTLGTKGTLAQKTIIFEKSMIFYAAEILLALNHMHGMGMIYRDLKPANVLINADGHIQLVDMGGAVDLGDDYSGKKSDKKDHVSVNTGSVLFGAEQSISASVSLLPAHSISPCRSHRSDASMSMKVMNDASSLSPSVIRGAARAVLAVERSSSQHSSPAPTGNSRLTLRIPSIHRAMSVVGTAGYMAPEVQLTTSDCICGHYYSIRPCNCVFCQCACTL
jgi:hypothetical protein